MTEHLLLSPWHLCLYGIGRLPSDASLRSSVAELYLQAQNELTGRLRSFEISKDFSTDLNMASHPVFRNQLGMHDLVNYAAHAISNGIESYDDVLESLYLNIEPGVLLFLLSDERSRYEFIMATAKLFSIEMLAPIVNQRFDDLIGLFQTLLQSITNPFLYARAAGLLHLAIHNVTTSADAQRINREAVTQTLQRLERDDALFNHLPVDGVHGPNDFRVFSWSILGFAFKNQFDSDDPETEQHLSRIKLKVETAFDSLPDHSKASQFSFFKLVFDRCRDENFLAETLQGVVFHYCSNMEEESPYSFLRSAYLLSEMAQSNATFEDEDTSKLWMCLSNRLNKIHNKFHGARKPTPMGANLSPISNSKYDSDILCFSYATIAQRLTGSKFIEEEMDFAAFDLCQRLHSTDTNDLTKLANVGKALFGEQQFFY